MDRQITFRSRSERISFQVKVKTLLVLAGLALLLLACMALAVLLGSSLTSLPELIAAAFGQGTAEANLIIGVLRLPRILLAVLAGAALAVSGAILQGVIRNPLASPDILGITGGASVAAVAFITYLLGDVSIRWLPVAAFAGAALVSLVIYVLAWQRGVTPIRLVLIGIGISAVTSALTTLMITLSPIKAAGQAYIWLTGSVYGASWENVYTLLPWLACFLPLALVFSRDATVQGLGDDVAKGLGSPVQRHRLLLLLISVALAGAAVAVVGSIGFVSLIAPHIARKLVGPSFASLLPAAAVVGSLMLLLADTVGRTAFLPQDVPAGVFTAAVGAPFFIFLLYRNRNR
ncbi:FecCD family ABC transporter permease [Brevibacillus marinus]|uniref:FecCD family ABC transporter permease n=1 Tax=Brevibacillus marinus TaxID=2496837 RepID=UPI000F8209E5|nr:iron ABC transporter permease [Brevibacillus marinus]